MRPYRLSLVQNEQSFTFISILDRQCDALIAVLLIEECASCQFIGTCHIIHFCTCNYCYRTKTTRHESSYLSTGRQPDGHLTLVIVTSSLSTTIQHQVSTAVITDYNFTVFNIHIIRHRQYKSYTLSVQYRGIITCAYCT